MDIETAAKCLAELGNPHRLETFRTLIKAGPEGLTVGEIQRHLGIPKSTLSHHISHLLWAGLVKQHREGRSLRCVADFELSEALTDFLRDECCKGFDDTSDREAGSA
ncbi:MAG: helix-turn-helix transcriptional regulator [Rhodospirillaceae bacterium]|jgi:ArsR family transcriptional regulator, arsenate/arsenite/antimonite-responsive transcriptional repressor|nr:helix-turn-helix transcriptional regulator [Rhodospirillaceae bacterium]MBT6136128.1 helix-turn-helix transcriptional regulator [Rhodospirillaceae bacterium]